MTPFLLLTTGTFHRIFHRLFSIDYFPSIIFPQPRPLAESSPAARAARGFCAEAADNSAARRALEPHALTRVASALSRVAAAAERSQAARRAAPGAQAMDVAGGAGGGREAAAWDAVQATLALIGRAQLRPTVPYEAPQALVAPAFRLAAVRFAAAPPSY